MLAIGKWAEKQLMDSLWDLAKNQLNVYKWWSEIWKPITLTEDTIHFLERTFSELSGNIIYQVYGWYSQLDDKNQSSNWWYENDWMSMYWIPLNWYEHTTKKLMIWTFFSEQQYNNAESVAIISQDLYERLFKWKNPIWEKIKFNKKTYAVIWVFEKEQQESWFEWKDYSMRIPYTTIVKRNSQQSEISSLVVYLPTTADNRLWRKRVLYALMKYYNKSDVSSSGIQVDSFSSYVDEMKKQSQTMNYLLIIIGSISLLVGWIWVMNIMLVSVTERTKEVWIRKALWALKSDIILQFLVESILITLIGWIIAIWLSFLVVRLVNKDWTSLGISWIITWNVVLIALIITSCTWIIFWILPANRAAKLNVIDAIRYE